MKDQVILLNPPADRKYIRDYYCSFSAKSNYYWPPQDLLVLSGILRQDYAIEFIDAIGAKIKESICRERIIKSAATILIFTTGTVSLEKDMEFISKIKQQRNDLQVIASSSIFRFLDKEVTVKYPFLDGLIADFTDKGIIDFLKEGNRTKNRIFSQKNTAPAVKDNNFNIGIPLQELFINQKNRLPFFKDSPFTISVGSVGCAFRCKFCIAGTMELRQRDLGEIIAEVKYIDALGIKKIFFVDPLFTADKDRVLEFCRNLQDNLLKIEWICNAHAATILDSGLLEKMKEAGCRALMIGVESGNDEILKKYAKGADTRQIKKAFALCRKTGIKTLAYFIIGLPGEDMQSIKGMIKFAKGLKCDYASFGFATPDIGTELRNASLLKKRVNEADWDKELDSSTNPVLSTDQLSAEEIRKFKNSAYRQFYLRPNYIIQRISEIRSLGDLRVLMEGGLLLLKTSILS